MRRLLVAAALLIVPTLLVAAPPPETAAIDRANEALAEGAPGKAAQVLRDALPHVTTPEAQARVRCLLGVATLAADQPGAAEKVLAQVPVDQVCGTRAGFLRADAIARQGRTAEATALYAELGGAFLGDDRDGRTVDALLTIVHKLLGTDGGHPAARELLDALLGLRISADRAASLARDLATDVRDQLTAPESHSEACDALVQAIATHDSRDDRLLAAEICDPNYTRLLLSPLPDDDPDKAWQLARIADPTAATPLRLRSLAARPDPVRQTALATILADADDLGALPLLQADPSADALKQRAELLLAAARPVDAEVALRAHLDSFPTDPHRAEVASAHARVLRDLGDAAATAGRWDDALQRYEALLAAHPEDELAPEAAYRSGIALRALGRAADARRRWEETVARFPGSAEQPGAALARMQAFDDHDPEGALAELRKRDAGGDELDRLQSPGLWVESRGRAVKNATIRIGTRNLEQVEVRLHTIDLEAYVRAGGAPGDLPSLDVAAIAPDRTFPVKVPGYEKLRDLAFDVPVPVGPGLYAVTVASAEQEAHALLLVSDLSVVARAVGDDLAVATFDADGRPVGGARVIVDDHEGRTDGSGLWTGTGGAGAPIVLAERNGSWAITTLPSLRAAGVSGGQVVLAELDRPVYLPGDRVGLRAVGRNPDRKPLVGRWTVWLSGPIQTDPVPVDTDAHGILVVDLPVPVLGTDAFVSGQPTPTTWTIQGIPPGSASPQALATFPVAPADPGGVTLDLEMVGPDAVASVRGPDGEPVAGVAVEWGDQGARTDAKGQVRVAGPTGSVPWAPEVEIPGGPRDGVARFAPNPWSLDLDLAQDRLRPGEAPAITVRLKGDEGRPESGPVDLVLYRLQPPVATEDDDGNPVDHAPPDPWVEAPTTGFAGPISWEGAEPTPPDRALEPVWRQSPTVKDGATIELPKLEPGDYRLVATLSDATAVATSDMSVSPTRLRLTGARDVGLGDVLDLAPDGTGALVTAESDHLLFAAVRPDRKAARVAVDPRWNGDVVVSATAPDGEVHVRHLDADPSLHVAIETAQEGDGLRVKATVRTASGRPWAANVALTAWDSRLERVVRPTSLPAWDVPGSAGLGGAIGADLRDGSVGEPIAPALLAEVEREKERLKAQQAADGLLSDNALAEAMLGDGTGLGLMGSEGVGGGASGYGMGSGSFGSRGYGAGGAGVLGQGWSVLGVRQRVLWSVGATDGDGVYTAHLTGPAARYTVRASAIGGEGVGTDQVEVDTTRRAWLVVHAPAPGAPGDQAVPWVTVVNGTTGDLAGPLQVGTASVDVPVAAGAAATVAVGDGRGPGPGVDPVRWNGASGSWSFPLVEGSPDPDGPLVVHADGLAPIVLRPDLVRLGDPARAAVAGRAAMAAMVVDPDPALVDAVRTARQQLLVDVGWSDARSGAVALLFLAEADRERIAPVRLAFGELAKLAEEVPSPVDPVERAWVLRARTAAGLEVDPNLRALVVADAAQDPDVAALLTLTDRRASGPLDPTTPLGAAASVLLRQPVDRNALLAKGPPDPGDPGLPDWVVAVRDAPGAVVSGTRRLRVEEGTTAGAWSWRAGPTRSTGSTGKAPSVQRLPRDEAGRPELSDLDPDDAGPCDPCTIPVGDVLVPAGLELGSGTPSGLALDWIGPGTAMLRATAPGRYRIDGLLTGSGSDDATGSVVVDVVPGPMPAGLSVGAVLARAQVAVDLGETPTLPPPPLEAPAAREVASLAFQAAVRTDQDAAVASTFRTLAATDPTASVPLASVARAARALAATGDPVAAIRAWRAGLDAAFAAEAAGIGNLEGSAGPLLAIQKVREAALRYPDGPLVGDALYLLPARLLRLADEGLPAQVSSVGITATDVRLTAAAWDREFLATYPSHRLATASGLRLARVLLTLGAPDRAAEWARRVSAQNPGAPLTDGLLYLEALARTEAGDAGGAKPLLDRLVTTPFPDEGGVLGPSNERDDARLVLGRLYESQGQIDRAVKAYQEASSVPEAARATQALTTTSLEAPAVVRLKGGEAASIPVEVTNLDELHVRAYKVDLRTLFLRDLGLSGATEIAVAGVSPAWSGTRSQKSGPFPESHDVTVPLNGPGAWLVQIEGGGATRSTLVVRSALALFAVDVGDARRLTLRRGGSPAVGVEVRALSAGQIVRVVTDVRGVAEVPPGAPVLAWSGDDWAFTDPDVRDRGVAPPAEPDETGLEPLLELLDQRIRQRQDQDEDQYQRRFSGASESLQLDAL